MADNTQLNLGTGGDVLRTVDRTAAKTQVVGLDFGGDTGAGNEQLVTATNPLPVAATDGAPVGTAFTAANVPEVSISGARGPGNVVSAIAVDAQGRQLAVDANSADQITRAMSSLGSTSADDIGNQRTVLDCLDATSETFVALPVAPMGLEVPGQAPAARSLPVALANEQVNDANFGPSAFGIGNLNINVLTGTAAPVDCSQYRSIGLQLNTILSGTVTVVFECSQDNVSYVAMPLTDQAAPTAAPVTSVAVAANTQRFFVGPIPFRYFRARISVAVATGALQAAARLSMSSFAPAYEQVASTAANAAVNVGSVGGNAVVTSANGVQQVGVGYVGSTAIVTGGVAGTLAVGGNVADGATPSLNALRAGGVDPAGLVRTVLTDRTGVVAVQQAAGVNGTPGPAETMLLVLAQLKVMTFYLRELSSSLNSGVPIADDEAAILNDPTLFN